MRTFYGSRAVMVKNMFAANAFPVIPAVLGMLGLFYGCTIPASESPVLASVAGQQLTLQEAVDAIPAMVLEQDSLQAISKYRQQWVQTRIMAEHAAGLRLDQTEAYREGINRIQQQLLRDLLQKAILSEHAGELEISDDEARQYYQTHREQFRMNERFVRFRHITTTTRAEAEEANRDLIAGVEWEEIADTYSTNPGLQKEFAAKFWPERLVLQEHPELRYFLSYIGLTERSPITFSNGYYHMIQLMEEKNEEEYPDLEILMPQIKEWLKIEKSRRIVNAYLRNLYLQAETNNEIYSAPVTELNDMLKNYQTPD